MSGSVKTVRFGVIGAGAFASRRHIPDILKNDDAVLAAICRRDPGELRKLADHFAPEHAYTDWRRMLDECEIDAVVVATPNSLHFEQAQAALARGVHVLVEKPMTVRAEEARKLSKMAAERGLHIAVALNPPHWAHCHAIRRAIRGGHIGEIESVNFYWTGNSGIVFGDKPMPEDMPGPVNPTLYRADPAQCGGGCFMDGGAHVVSEILWTTGLRATRVACLMDQTPSDRRTAMIMTLENGAIASISSIADSSFAARRVRNTFGGSHGTITVDGFEFATTIATVGGAPETVSEADLMPVPGPVDNLVDTILRSAPLNSDAAHGVHVQEVLEAAYTAAAQHKTIRIPAAA